MALTDTKLRTLKPREQTFSESDGGGLFVEVTLKSVRTWRLRYRLAGKQGKVTLGEYPAYSLAEARQWRDDCTALAKRGLSPMALRRGDPIPEDAKPEVKELAQAFIRDWCLKTVEIDFDKAEWSIPGERMKKDKSHLVPLSRQAVAMFEELKELASHSEWVFPSRGSLTKPISHSTLNVAVRALEIDVRDFVIHDFRRTASTHLHEAGFNSDWIEKALAHETKGIRGVYNRVRVHYRPKHGS